MGQQIDKCHDKLFADPISVKTPNGLVTVYPQRTNNIIEQLFRAILNAYRRKTGNNSMRRTKYSHYCCIGSSRLPSFPHFPDLFMGIPQL